MDVAKYKKEARNGNMESRTYITYKSGEPGYEVVKKLQSMNIDVKELVYSEFLSKVEKEL